jgi:hypothetical protein
VLSRAEQAARVNCTLEDVGAADVAFFVCLCCDARNLERDVSRHTFNLNAPAVQQRPFFRAMLARLCAPADMQPGRGDSLSGALLPAVDLLTEALDLFNHLERLFPQA